MVAMASENRMRLRRGICPALSKRFAFLPTATRVPMLSNRSMKRKTKTISRKPMRRPGAVRNGDVAVETDPGAVQIGMAPAHFGVDGPRIVGAAAAAETVEDREVGQRLARGRRVVAGLQPALGGPGGAARGA